MSAHPHWHSARMAQVKSILQGPALISIIGDSTGNDGNEWVAYWSQRLAEAHRVYLHRWVDNRYQPMKLTYGLSGTEIDIWNAGQPGAPADWAVDRLNSVQPRRPDLLIISSGHNNTSDNIEIMLERLRNAVLARWGQIPTVLILQNPGRGAHEQRQADTSRAAAAWAIREQVPYIDVAPAFTDPDLQMRDDVHPNELGSRLWADAVAAVIS